MTKSLTDLEALHFQKHAFMDRYDEDDDLTCEQRVIDNLPLGHPDLPGWVYKPADVCSSDPNGPAAPWNGGSSTYWWGDLHKRRRMRR